MHNITVTGFRENMLPILEQTIKYNEPVNVVMDNGNVIILSDEDYRGMIETINLLSIPGMREKLIDGKTEPVSDCIPEEKVVW